MRVIIAGSRTISDKATLFQALSLFKGSITQVVSGTASGADKLGENWAIANKVPLRKFPAEWNKYGKAAGYKRNEEMAQNADALIALWDGISRGTKHMIDIALDHGLIVLVFQDPKGK